MFACGKDVKKKKKKSIKTLNKLFLYLYSFRLEEPEFRNCSYCTKQ